MAKAKVALLYIFACLYLFIAYASCAQQHTSNRYDSLRGTLNSFRASYDVKYYELHIKVDVVQKSISGFNIISFTTLENTDTIQVDLFHNLSIDSIIYKKAVLSFYRDSNHVFLIFPKTINKNTHSSVLFYYHGSPLTAKAPPWDGGFVWDTDSLKRPWLTVACEGLGASSWWPMKDHLSDEPDSAKLFIEVPGGLTCISNGVLLSTTPKKNGTTEFKWTINYPINSYNITLNIGYYTHFNDYLVFKHDTLSLDYYVLDFHASQARKHFKQVPTVLKSFSKHFGPYPFPKDGYALVETPYWGMEHQGAIAYGNHFKNDIYDFDFIIVHETAHEWWGNSLSVSDHADMWIHEAFATYAESILIEDTYGYKTALEYLHHQKLKIKNNQPMQGPIGVNYNEWKDTDIYYKGAWMLHTLRNVLQNDSLWFALLQHLNSKFKISNVNSKGLIDEISAFTKKSWEGFFQAYLSCSAIPQLEYYTVGQRNNEHLYFRWKSCADNFQIPISLVINGKEVQLNPSSEWQSIEVRASNKLAISFNADRYYIQLSRVSSPGKQ